MKKILNILNIIEKNLLKQYQYKKEEKALSPELRSRCTDINIKNLKAMKKIINKIIVTPSEMQTTQFALKIIKKLEKAQTTYIKTISEMAQNPANEVEALIAEKTLNKLNAKHKDRDNFSGLNKV